MKPDGSANLTVRDYRGSIFHANISRAELKTLAIILRQPTELLLNDVASPRQRRHIKSLESTVGHALIHGEPRDK